MRRTRQHVALTAALACLAPAAADAYHTGKVFDDAPGAGGGGGVFYTGSPSVRRWDCTVCHIDAPGTLQVSVTSQPPELATEQRYTPGMTYQLTVAMDAPTSQLGLGSPRSNFNAMVIAAEDATGGAAGVFVGFDSGKFYARGNALLASDSPDVNETSWSFNWTAPPAGTGAVTLWFGVVDGNGANASASETHTDALGDDVAMRALALQDGVAARAFEHVVAGGLAYVRAALWLATGGFLED
jgi:hypothetical protein